MGFLMTTIQFANSLEWLTELSNVLYWQLQLYYKDYKPMIQMKRCTGSGPGGFQTQSLCSLLPVKAGCVTLGAHQCVHHPESSTERQCPEFLPGFWPRDWTQCPAHHPPWRVVGYIPWTRPSTGATTWLVFLVWSLCTLMPSGDPPWITSLT